MIINTKYKKITIFILITSLIFGQFSILAAASESSYTLQNSKVMNEAGEWVQSGVSVSSDIQHYNCYAYAINRFDIGKFHNYNYDDQYQPGGIYPNLPNQSCNYSLDEVRDNVLLDLDALGYTDISVYYDIDDIPDTIDFSTYELICFRMGGLDYHFMKFDDETQSWYHKPSLTAILKYTDNNGIPSNSKDWNDERVDVNGNVLESDKTYTGNIWYIVYNKLQLTVSTEGELEQSINIKGGTTPYSGKDAFYEIVVSESGCYTIQITTPTVTYNTDAIANFNYEIYSYNMYNGNYTLTSGRGQSGSTFTETVNLTTYNDYNDGSNDWQYQTFKYYIRLDFGKLNQSDVSVNVNITHQHEYTHNYEQSSTTQHKAYCWCGEYEIRSHSFNHSFEQATTGKHKGYCECGAFEIESHSMVEYEYLNNDYHIGICECGVESRGHHTVETTNRPTASCVYCHATVTVTPGTIMPWGSEDEPELN